MILLKTVSLTGGSNRPSNSQLSQQYRTELNTLDVLLSQTVKLRHRVSGCTCLTFYSLFFSCCCLVPVCSLPTLLSSSLISFLSPPCPSRPPPPLQSAFLCAIFTFSLFPVLPCFLLPLSPLQSLFCSPFSMTRQWQ